MKGIVTSSECTRGRAPVLNLTLLLPRPSDAKKFKEAFVEAQQRVSPEQLEESAVETGSETLSTSADGGGAEVTDSLAALSVQEPPAPAAASDS